MKEEILQKLIDNNGNYLLAHRYQRAFGAMREDTHEALLICPDIPRELWGKNILELPFGVVREFAKSEIKTIIHLGKTYGPFQLGIRNDEFIAVQDLTCTAMELVVKCYNENIKDYYMVIEAMESLTLESSKTKSKKA